MGSIINKPDASILLEILDPSGDIAAGFPNICVVPVHDEQGGSTYCHECGERLICRAGYILKGWGITADGQCRSCGAPCAGVFEETAGTWGARRVPLRIGSSG